MKDTTFMEIAKIIAKESYCKRSKVGAVLVKNNRIISVGYNGTPIGKTKWVEDETIPFEGYSIPDNTCEDKNGNTRKDVIHAEMNAILFAAKNGIPTNGCGLYVTMSPCSECAKAIIQSGIKEVIYDKEYRLTEGIDILKASKIEVRRIR